MYNTVKNHSIELVSANAIMEMDITPPTAFVEGILFPGVYLLAGLPKIGKSWLMYHLADCIARGEPFLGTYKTQKNAVLYLALEDTNARIQERLIATNGGNHVEGLYFSEKLLGTDDEFVKSLSSTLDSHPEIRVVIIDPLVMVRETKTNRDLYKGDYNAILPFVEMAHTKEIAIILVHHLNKKVFNDKNDILLQISGTNGLPGAVDCNMILQKGGSDGNLELYIRGRDNQDLVLSLNFNNKRTWTLLNKESIENKMAHTICSDALSQFLKNLRGCSWEGTATELSEELKGIDSSLNIAPNALSQLLGREKDATIPKLGYRLESSRSSNERTISLIAEKCNTE